ncbi:hypothetical protein B0I35DRAFT_435871 [Stachybotrys elegans]|uniref:Uncharacterized protein n=1 Tax=Stachybotrys elegans TaxID=80388 RepID=A0A8K0SSJ8_9HYPO|nr:hypothetical protein B0I35DRAFT_435871 [Stachybotrys elegans]
MSLPLPRHIRHLHMASTIAQVPSHLILVENGILIRTASTPPKYTRFVTCAYDIIHPRSCADSIAEMAPSDDGNWVSGV